MVQERTTQYTNGVQSPVKAELWTPVYARGGSEVVTDFYRAPFLLIECPVLDFTDEVCQVLVVYIRVINHVVVATFWGSD